MSVVSMEVGPRDYLMEMLRLLGTVLGGSSRFLPLLASKADQCLQITPRSMSATNGSPKVIELGDSSHGSDDGRFVNGTGPSTPYDTLLDPGLWNGTIVNGYDFGSLSEASTAWLGSLPDDYGDLDVSGAEFDDVPVFQTPEML